MADKLCTVHVRKLAPDLSLELNTNNAYYSKRKREKTCLTTSAHGSGNSTHNAHMEPIKKRIFHVKQVLNFKCKKDCFDIDRFTKLIDKFGHPKIK